MKRNTAAVAAAVCLGYVVAGIFLSAPVVTHNDSASMMIVVKQ